MALPGVSIRLTQSAGERFASPPERILAMQEPLEHGDQPPGVHGEALALWALLPSWDSYHVRQRTWVAVPGSSMPCDSARDITWSRCRLHMAG
ncbi:hypothetical protein E2C01_073260 [Portunus trituberculatus]|uniref:Uncharacterized protein n=1 Tax=Portunus trituberculatus TaxID=210409 RepID=A0A5B7I8Z1_PORTR|nr:hypothetical protein [Portunus trituberculatus]